ncbi:hypothetical protein NQZ68_019326 [Dissostichus eleginoides]|nr:hypothetical protein NQZ68_019326 [Dissostichus eleginoides]
MGARLPTSTSDRKKTLSDVTDLPAPMCHVSAKDRQRSRSLDHIEKLESLDTSSDGKAEDLLLMWRLMQKQDCLAFLPSVQTSTHTDRPVSLAIFLSSQHLQLILLS